MSVINDVQVKVSGYYGKGELEFLEDEIRFNVLKKNNHVVAGALFGILGRLIAEAMSSGGKQLFSFTPADVAHVKYSAASGKVLYYFYMNGNTVPCEIDIEENTYLNKLIKQHFADKLEAIQAR